MVKCKVNQEKRRVTKKYASLSKKYLQKFVLESEKYGNLISDKYNEQRELHDGRECLDGDLVFFILFREWINILVGVGTLYSANLNRQSIILIRTMYELFLQMNYLTIDQLEMHCKGTCYLHVDTWKRIRDINNEIIYSESVGNKIVDELKQQQKNLKACYDEILQTTEGKIIDESIRDLIGSRGYLNGNWYLVYEHIKNKKTTNYSLKTMSTDLNKRLKEDFGGQDTIKFFYEQLYNFMSQYAHGTSLAEKLKTDEFGPYFVPADNPKNGILGLEIIRVMFTELILVIKRVYFYGSEGSWNDTRQVDCIDFLDKQSKILKQIYECDDELP